MIRTFLWVLVATVVVSTVGLIVGGRQIGTEYPGDSFDIWVKRAGPDAEIESAAVREGPTLIPELVKLLDWQPTRSELGSQKVYAWLPESWRPEFRLLNLAYPEDLRPRLLRVLGEYGPEAASALLTVLMWAESQDDSAREALVAALRIAPYSPEVSALVVAGVADDQPAVRDATAQALWVTDTPVEEALVLLQNSFSATVRPSPSVVRALGVYGASASRAVPRLIPWLTDPELQPDVLETLRRIGSASAVGLTEVRKGLSPESPVLAETLVVLGAMGPAAVGALPEIRRYADHDAPLVRVLVAAVRARLGDDLPGAVERLAQEVRFQIPDRTLRYTADAPGLREVSLSPAEAAAWLSGTLGKKAQAAAPDLEVAVKSDDPRLSILAAWALWRITGESEVVVPAVRRGLRFAADPVVPMMALSVAEELGTMAQLLSEELVTVRGVSLPVRRRALELEERLALDPAGSLPR